MKFSRINLNKTKYKLYPYAKLLRNDEVDIAYLQNIYKEYTDKKNFSSVMPIFDKEYLDNDIIGYYDNNKLVAFSLIGKYDNLNVENYQFAWTYHKPELKLGIRSLEHECAYYKILGYQYLYLGSPDNYKQNFDGFEILGKLK